jgi:hypothetical protein
MKCIESEKDAKGSKAESDAIGKEKVERGESEVVRFTFVASEDLRSLVSERKV